jgi:hypothetical protein
MGGSCLGIALAGCVGPCPHQAGASADDQHQHGDPKKLRLHIVTIPNKLKSVKPASELVPPELPKLPPEL